MKQQELASLLAKHAAPIRVPGAVVGVLGDGAETIAAYGIGDVRTGVAVTEDSRFAAGSLTKSMVAAVVARLAARSQVDLDDPVASHVPELARTGWARAATIRDLLANRSGLPLRLGLDFDFDSPDVGDDALARFAARVADEAPTSVGWSYSNAGYALLGRVIETVTGEVWEEAMRTQLFVPAGMTRTVFALPGVTVDRVAGHEVSPTGPQPVEPLASRALGPAGTTLVSTVGDLLAFARLELEDPTLAVLRDPGGEVRIHGWLDHWCLGLARFDWRGGTAWGWDSVAEGERGVLRFVPERRAAVVLLANGSTGRLLNRTLLPELMRSLLGIEVPPLRLDAHAGAAGDLARYAGTYAWPDRRVDVSVSGETLVITKQGLVQEARPINDQAFLVDPDDPDNPTVTFASFDGAGRPNVLYVMLWGLPRIS